MTFDVELYEQILKSELYLRQTSFKQSTFIIPKELGVATSTDFTYFHNDISESEIIHKIICFDAKNSELIDKLNSNEEEMIDLLNQVALVIIENTYNIKFKKNLERNQKEDEEKFNDLLWKKILPVVKNDVQYYTSKAGLPSVNLPNSINGDNFDRD